MPSHSTTTDHAPSHRLTAAYYPPSTAHCQLLTTIDHHHHHHHQPPPPVLKGVTGKFLAGRVAAIMGPSGVGKTTFLNTLCGRATYGEMTGDVFINGEKDSVKRYTNLVGLVPQDDIMHPWLSVKETLWMYAKLRHRQRTTLDHDTVNDKVTNVMMVLGLFPQRHKLIGDEVSRGRLPTTRSHSPLVVVVSHSSTHHHHHHPPTHKAHRGISGGQRKRVNVAMELVLDPSVLFLDEPTSGLDSTTSYELVHALRSISKRGVNVVAVLHQPSAKIYRMFHDVLLLGSGGCTVYLGPSSNALPYFKVRSVYEARELYHLHNVNVPTPRSTPRSTPARTRRTWVLSAPSSRTLATSSWTSLRARSTCPRPALPALAMALHRSSTSLATASTSSTQRNSLWHGRSYRRRSTDR